MTRIGYFRKTRSSNRVLVSLFEEIQQLRSESTYQDWQEQGFVRKLTSLEKLARKKILILLKSKKLKTSDDFLRAADIFHHGPDFQSYMIAVALAAISNHLGEPWGKNHFAVAIDRLLQSLGLPQHFGTQYSKIKGKWQLDKVDLKTTDKERLEYGVEPIRLLKKRVRDMDKGITFWKTELKD